MIYLATNIYLTDRSCQVSDVIPMAQLSSLHTMYIKQGVSQSKAATFVKSIISQEMLYFLKLIMYGVHSIKTAITL